MATKEWSTTWESCIAFALLLLAWIISSALCVVIVLRKYEGFTFKVKPIVNGILVLVLAFTTLISAALVSAKYRRSNHSEFEFLQCNEILDRLDLLYSCYTTENKPCISAEASAVFANFCALTLFAELCHQFYLTEINTKK